MNIEDFRNYCLSLGDVTEKTPFGKFARRYESILVFYVCGHMFCLADMDDFTSVSVRSTPEEIENTLLRHSSVSKPMNQALRNWIQLDFGGDFSDSEIYSMIDRAYEIIRLRYTGR